MKKTLLFLPAMILFIIGQAFAGPINQNTVLLNIQNPQYVDNWSCCGYGYQDIENYSGGWNAAGTLFHESGSWAFIESYGSNPYWMEGETWNETYSNTKGWITDNYSFEDGSLFNDVFHSKTDTVTGSFTGSYEAYNSGKGWYYWTYVTNGKFSDNLSTNSFTLTAPGSMPGTNTVPEPGSLALFGTGLTGIGTLIRKKLAKA